MNLYKTSLFALFVIGLSACNLNREVDIDLPNYESQPVVECYLTPGSTYKLTLTKSNSYFDPFGNGDLLQYLDAIQIKNARVEIRHGLDTIVLANTPTLDPVTLKAYNYVSDQMVPFDFEGSFELYIQLEDGREITGLTNILAAIPIDSVVVSFNETDTLARTLCYITDPDLSTRQYFRRFLNYDSLDSIPEQDFITDDQLIESGQFVFGSGYENRVQDTVFNTIATIDKAYFSFITSVMNSAASNGNPFAQPGVIKSNVFGSAKPLGIFTGYAQSQIMTIIAK
ncbi:MAG: DUF4249 family protein [Saprospiraceae bacterium]